MMHSMGEMQHNRQYHWLERAIVAVLWGTHGLETSKTLPRFSTILLMALIAVVWLGEYRVELSQHPEHGHADPSARVAYGIIAVSNFLAICGLVFYYKRYRQTALWGAVGTAALGTTIALLICTL